MDKNQPDSSADLQWIRTTLENAFERGLDGEGVIREEVGEALGALLVCLEAGAVRVAEPQGHRWSVNTWVKKGLLVGLRIGEVIAPGAGVHMGTGVIVLPHSHIDTGVYLDEGVLVEPHVLVGSCAQVGRRVHLGAAVQLGGMLEPVEARPVIIEDDVMIGGGCGVYEGTIVRRRAVLAAGVVLTASTPVYDIVKGDVLRPAFDKPLEIPDGAVVVAGARKLEGEWGAVHGLSLQSQIIVKYRDEDTDPLAALEEGLR